MKRTLLIILSLALVLTLAACGSSKQMQQQAVQKYEELREKHDAYIALFDEIKAKAAEMDLEIDSFVEEQISSFSEAATGYGGMMDSEIKKMKDEELQAVIDEMQQLIDMLDTGKGELERNLTSLE